MIYMLQASTTQLLRIKFSFLLMPVYWFALGQINDINILNASIIFIILHLFIYPASNAYNSYMDKDKGSIGCIKNPKTPTKQLFYASIFLDVIGFISGLIISYYFALALLLYISASRAYSYRGIRLKKYPFISYIIAVVFQGGLVYFMVYHGSNVLQPINVSYIPMVASTLMVGSFYPLTQIYQHKQDKADDVKTISMLLGYTGTFIFSAICYFVSMVFMGYYFAGNLELDRFLVLVSCMFPTLLFFIWWFFAVKKNTVAASFKNAMKMNWIAAGCSNVGFLVILLMKEKF
ncbi:MAG: UbiA family prenyltransferase [Ferruginibacter sp.]|nr:UbiA family prenyltransferase [Ferruginibacter sp.]